MRRWMRCGVRWMRCTVRNKWQRTKKEKDKERINTENAQAQKHRDHREELRKKPPKCSGAFCFAKKEGRRDLVGAPLRELVGTVIRGSRNRRRSRLRTRRRRCLRRRRLLSAASRGLP